MPIPALLAPLLAQGMSLVANAVLAKGKGWVEEKVGVKLDQPLSAEDTLKLRQFEMDHQEELLRLRQEDNRIDAELEKAYLQDVQDARGLQKAALAQDDLFSKRFIYYLAIFWSIAAAVYIGFITFGYIPEANVRFADTILGFLLGTLIATILNFFYGSSRGSSSTRQVLEDVVSKVAGSKQ
jgi:hypothetical protein